MRTLTLIFIASLLFCSTVEAQSEGDVIISEIMEDPAQVYDVDGEYVEVFNATATDVDLDGWTIKDGGGTHTFSTSVIVPAEGFAVLCRNEDEDSNGGVSCAGEFTGPQLANGSDEVVLMDDTDMEIDRVEYDDTSWPTAEGASMEFLGAPGDENNDPANWQEATEKKGDFEADESADIGSPNANASAGALPVELANFQVVAKAERAELTWRTVSETNNTGFAVQHRGPASEAWRDLGFVPGAGTTTDVQSYRYTTEALRAGTHRFRLKQVDADGSVHVSAPEALRITAEAGLLVHGRNPLGRGQTFRVSVQVEREQAIEVALYDVLGQRVRTIKTVRATPSRPVQTTISTAGLSSGTYVLRAQGTSFAATEKISIVR